MTMLNNASRFSMDQNSWGSYTVSTVPAMGIELAGIYSGQQGNVETGQNSGTKRFGDAVVDATKSLFSKQALPGTLNAATKFFNPTAGIAGNPLVELGGGLLGDVAGKVAGNIGLNANPLAGAAIDFGVQGLGKILGKDTNYSDVGSQVVDKVAGAASMFGPIGMAAGAAIKLANMLGSQTVEGVTHNEQDQAQLGSSYNLSQYDKESKSFGLAGIGAANRYKKEVKNSEYLLDRASDVAQDSYNAQLKQQYGTETVANRNKMKNMGGVKVQSVKNGGIIIHSDFIKKCNELISHNDNPVESLKNGGSVNVIPSGKLHKERHRLEERDDSFKDISKKGIPIVSIKDGNEIVQHAEIEKEELVLRLELTQKLEELMESDDDDAAYQAGLVFFDELFNNTEDNTGLIKRVKA